MVIILSSLAIGVILLVLALPFPLLAETDNTSDNFTLTDLLPDIEKIYREALINPHLEAAKQIQDADIARYYNLLLERCGLDKIEPAPN